MNTKNLKAIATLCRTLSQKDFNMRYYRMGDSSTSECGSVGCVLGHATVLDQGELPLNKNGNINFEEWGEIFTGLRMYSREWRWCFANFWAGQDNTPLGAAARIDYLLAGREVPNMFSGPTAEMVAMYS
jgi:hypothetical protein